MKTFLRKDWISPFIGFSFFILALTGILMMLHIKNGALVHLHEWMGVTFVVVAIGHLVLNMRPLLARLNAKAGIYAIIAVLVLSFCFIIGGWFGNHHGYAEKRGAGFASIRHR